MIQLYNPLYCNSNGLFRYIRMAGTKYTRVHVHARSEGMIHGWMDVWIDMWIVGLIDGNMNIKSLKSGEKRVFINEHIFYESAYIIICNIWTVITMQTDHTAGIYFRSLDANYMYYSICT